MPIKPGTTIQLKTEEEFREIDYRVMGKAFDIHNEFGPHFNEIVYKNELAFRLAEIGLRAVREFPIDLVFQQHSKRVFVDLFVDNSIVYEIKTAASFAPAHRSQALNYLFATGTKHGKLINFRGAKVEGEYVSTSLDHEDRRVISVHDSERDPLDTDASRWRELVMALIADWGSGLDLNWYREALGDVLGGLSRAETEMAIVSNGRPIGSHRIRLLTADAMWTLTAVKDQSVMKENLRKLLSLSHLKRIHWANIQNHQLQFQTLKR
jgi:GxxExxY protein